MLCIEHDKHLNLFYTLLISDPFILPWMRVDKGAIRFILSGAHIMCPGLTSKMAKMSEVSDGE